MLGGAFEQEGAGNKRGGEGKEGVLGFLGGGEGFLPGLGGIHVQYAMYHAACTVQFKPFNNRSYSQPTFFNFHKN